jgi:hypothetical protein
MAERWDTKSVEFMERWLQDELLQVGLIPASARVHIQRGSAANGRAWRLNVIREDSGAHYNVPGCPDYIGWTGAEARLTCGWIADVLRAARRMRGDDAYMARQVQELTA